MGGPARPGWGRAAKPLSGEGVDEALAARGAQAGHVVVAPRRPERAGLVHRPQVEGASSARVEAVVEAGPHARARRWRVDPVADRARAREPVQSRVQQAQTFSATLDRE